MHLVGIHTDTGCTQIQTSNCSFSFHCSPSPGYCTFSVGRPHTESQIPYGQGPAPLHWNENTAVKYPSPSHIQATWRTNTLVHNQHSIVPDKDLCGWNNVLLQSTVLRDITTDIKAVAMSLYQINLPASIFARMVRAHFMNTSSTLSPVSALVSRKESSVQRATWHAHVCAHVRVCVRRILYSAYYNIHTHYTYQHIIIHT